jgi:hypothetical protein
LKSLQLKKTSVKGWTWFLKNPEMLKGWFEDYEKHLHLKKIKSNSIRTVFKVKGYELPLVVKYECPCSAIDKLKARFNSKARSEFKSALLLKKLSIPCVEYLGWGRKGHQSMLLSKELLKYINAKDFWFESAANKNKFKLLFLRGLASFLKIFFKADLYHPDFHIGNLLVNPETFDFCIVDPYGIRKALKIPEKKKFEMFRLIGALRAELSVADAVELILRSGMADSNSKAKNLWKKILRKEAEEVEELWEKRKKQILSGKSKYSTEVMVDKYKSYMIRNTMSSKPALPLDSVIDELPESEFLCISVPQNDAMKIWLESFKLQFHRIQHPAPLVWEKTGLDSDFVYWRRSDIEKFQNIITDHEFHERCRTANQSKTLSFIISSISED